MSRQMNWKSWVVLGLAAAVLATSGGLVTASNFGFKINKVFYPNFNQIQAPKRVNWISLPYNSPYTNAKLLCNALGSSAAGTTIFQLNPSTGAGLTSPSPYPCSFNTVSALDSTRGVRVQSSGTTPVNAVLVGSSNESQAMPTILSGFNLTAAPKKDNWISVPYHTTWVKAEDVCVTIGITGVNPNTGNVIRVNGDPTTGSNTVSHPCGNTTINNFSLVIGEAVDVRKNQAGTDVVGKLPPHF
jgi:hypothetical protein